MAAASSWDAAAVFYAYRRDEDRMVERLLEVNKLFKPDGQCCSFI